MLNISVSPHDIPGIKVTESRGSKAGNGFITANGERVGNEGECCLSFQSEDGAKVETTFQVAGVPRPLLAIGKACDKGNSATFTKEKAIVYSPAGKGILTFTRERGLYVAKVKAKRGGGSFQRQGAKK